MKQSSMSSVVIYVDRTIRPIYPNGCLKVCRKKEKRPTKFNIRCLKKMPYQKQDKSLCMGSRDYEFLRDNNLRGVCLDIYDLIAIKERGAKFFRKHFGWEAVFGMGSVVRIDYKTPVPPSKNTLHAPYIYVANGKVELRWCWLDIRGSWPITWGIWRYR